MQRNRWGGVFLAYGALLTAISSFRYLRQMLSSSKDDWPEVEKNLQRARGKWGRLVKILEREGADRIMVGRFYVSVVQAVLLFGSETWVLISRSEKSLKGFHHRVMRRMAGMGPKCQQYGT